MSETVALDTFKKSENRHRNTKRNEKKVKQRCYRFTTQSELIIIECSPLTPCRNQ